MIKEGERVNKSVTLVYENPTYLIKIHKTTTVPTEKHV